MWACVEVSFAVPVFRKAKSKFNQTVVRAFVQFVKFFESTVSILYIVICLCMLSDACKSMGFIHVLLALFLALRSHVLGQMVRLLVLWHFHLSSIPDCVVVCSSQNSLLQFHALG